MAIKEIKIDKYVFHVSKEDEEAYYKFVEDKGKHFPKQNICLSPSRMVDFETVRRLAEKRKRVIAW